MNYMRLRGRYQTFTTPISKAVIDARNTLNLRFPAFYMLAYGVGRIWVEIQSERKFGAFLTVLFQITA